MSGDFIPRAKANAISRALSDLIMGEVRRSLEYTDEWSAELCEAARTGGAAKVRVLLKARFDELSNSIDDLVRAAKSEIDAAAIEDRPRVN